ncbi:Uncharacterised protein [Bordetella pertussis]|nr:Uncharacterised protein [Bordetella pertussis]
MPGEQDVDHHRHRAPEVQLGNPADAAVDPGRRGPDGQDHGAHDQGDLQRQALLQPENQRETDVEQHHADAHRGRHAEHRADQRDDADAVAQGAAHALAQQRIERRADGQGHAPAVGEVSHRHAQQGIHGPARHPVVEHRPDDRVLHGCRRAALAGRRMQVLHDRPGDREEKHVDPDAGGKQHRDPGRQPVLRPRMIGAEAHVSLLGKRDPQHETDHQRHGQHVVPAQIGRNPVDGRLHPHARIAGHQDRPYRERDDHGRRDQQHTPIYAGRTALEHLLGPLAEVAARHRRIVAVLAFRAALRAAEPAAFDRPAQRRGLRVRRLAGRPGLGPLVVGWCDRHG